MTNPSVAQVETDDAVGPAATTAITPPRQLFADHLSPILDHPQEVSPPSPMAQASADAAMRLEMAQLRAELGLLRTQMGKQAQARDTSAPRRSPRRSSPLRRSSPMHSPPRRSSPASFAGPLHREVDASADTGEAETAKQDAEEAAKFYKEELRKLRIQVGEQNKAIAELRALPQRPQKFNLSPAFEKVRESEPVAAGQGKGDGGGRPDPMWQSQGDAWGQWKKAQPPGLSESQTEELPNEYEEYDQYHSYNRTQNWSGKWYHQEWRGRYYDDDGYRGPRGYIDKKISSNQRLMAATYQSGWHGKAPSYAT